jgi:hypothetical protein
MVGMTGKQGLLLAVAVAVGMSVGSMQAQADLGLGGTIATAATTQPAATATQPAKTKEQQKDENTHRVMEFFRLNAPYAYDQAVFLQKSDPARFDLLMSHSIGWVKGLESVQKKNKPLFDLKMKDVELSYDEAGLRDRIKRPDVSPEDKESLIKQLTDKLNEHFEVGQNIRAAEIEDLKKELAECEQKLQDRAGAKDDWIKKQLDTLISGVPVADK